jgi:hypothetical protein
MDRFDEMLKLYEQIKDYFKPTYRWYDYINPFYTPPQKDPFILIADFHPNYIDRTKSPELIYMSMSHNIHFPYNVIYGNMYLLYERERTFTYEQFNERCKLIEKYFRSASRINRWHIKVEREIVYDEIIHRKDKEYDFSTYRFKISVIN